MLGLWGVRSIPLLTFNPGPLWPGVVVPDRVLSVGQLELFDIQTVYKQMTNGKLNCFEKIFII